MRYVKKVEIFSNDGKFKPQENFKSETEIQKSKVKYKLMRLENVHRHQPTKS